MQGKIIMSVDQSTIQPVIVPVDVRGGFDFVRKNAEKRGGSRIWKKPVVDGEPNEVSPIVAVDVYSCAGKGFPRQLRTVDSLIKVSFVPGRKHMIGR